MHHNPPPNPTTQDTYQTLQQRLPKNAQTLLHILNPDTRPHNYTQQYGNTTPKNTHLAKYLNTTPKQIKKLKKTIQHHAQLLQLGH